MHTMLSFTPLKHALSQFPGCEAFTERLPGLALSFMGELVVEQAEGGYLGFLAAATQLAAHPLTQFHEECCCICMLLEGMDGTLRLGYFVL